MQQIREFERARAAAFMAPTIFIATSPFGTTTTLGHSSYRGAADLHAIFMSNISNDSAAARSGKQEEF